MKRIYSVLVENRSGVLCKVAGLFWRRCFNIDSLAVGETEDKNVSNMIIVSTGDRRTLEQLVKVRYNRTNRKDIMENCEIMDAKIVDISKTMMTIQICDTPERVQIFLDTLKSVSIIEIARTGTLALLKCSEQGK